MGMRETARGHRLVGCGVVLRVWSVVVLPAMVELFDEPEVAYRTPLASPFDLPAARDYLKMIRRTHAKGERIHLAITTEGGRARGEVVLNLTSGTIGYAVGIAHRGQGLAVQAVLVLTGYAHRALATPRLRTQIEPDNRPSIAGAGAAGGRRTGEPAEPGEDKGRSYTLLSWAHEDHGS